LVGAFAQQSKSQQPAAPEQYDRERKGCNESAGEIVPQGIGLTGGKLSLLPAGGRQPAMAMAQGRHVGRRIAFPHSAIDDLYSDSGSAGNRSCAAMGSMARNAPKANGSSAVTTEQPRTSAI
jgi:hypothetical protein